MNIVNIQVGDTVHFVPCGQCVGNSSCFFCNKGVKNMGVVVEKHENFDIQTIEVKVEGSDRLLELTQDDIEDPELVEKIER